MLYQNLEDKIDAATLLEALEGDEYESVFLTSCTVEGVVDIASLSLKKDENGALILDKDIVCIHCTFENLVKFPKTAFRKELVFSETVFQEPVDFRGSTFQGHCDFGQAEFRARVSFRSAIFQDEVNFWQANFHDMADFNEVEFQDGAIFGKTRFHGVGHFGQTVFQQALDFSYTRFSDTVTFEQATFGTTADFTSARFAFVASYRDIRFMSDTLQQWFQNKWKRDARPPTEFYLDSHHVDEVSNPFFKRYVADQQFIRVFKQRSPLGAQLWRWSSDYGRSLGLWAFWSLFLAVVFAGAYSIFPPVLENFELGDFAPNIIQNAGDAAGSRLTFGSAFYFSVVTFTTLGFGDVVAENGPARFLVTVEVILGYLMLGGLISIFANKLASRS